MESKHLSYSKSVRTIWFVCIYLTAAFPLKAMAANTCENLFAIRGASHAMSRIYEMKMKVIDFETTPDLTHPTRFFAIPKDSATYGSSGDRFRLIFNYVTGLGLRLAYDFAKKPNEMQIDWQNKIITIDPDVMPFHPNEFPPEISELFGEFSPEKLAYARTLLAHKSVRRGSVRELTLIHYIATASGVPVIFSMIEKDPGVRILPDSVNTAIGKVANSLQKNHGVRIGYYRKKDGVGGTWFESEKLLSVTKEALTDGKIDETFIHEVRHMNYRTKDGQKVKFPWMDFSLHAKGQELTSAIKYNPALRIYKDYFRADEIAARLNEINFLFTREIREALIRKPADPHRTPNLKKLENELLLQQTQKAKKIEELKQQLQEYENIDSTLSIKDIFRISSKLKLGKDIGQKKIKTSIEITEAQKSLKEISAQLAAVVRKISEPQASEAAYEAIRKDFLHSLYPKISHILNNIHSFSDLSSAVALQMMRSNTRFYLEHSDVVVANNGHHEIKFSADFLSGSNLNSESAHAALNKIHVKTAVVARISRELAFDLSHLASKQGPAEAQRFIAVLDYLTELIKDSKQP